MTVLFTIAGVTAATAIGVVWLLDSRATRRLDAVLDGYARREMARARDLQWSQGRTTFVRKAGAPALMR